MNFKKSIIAICALMIIGFSACCMDAKTVKYADVPQPVKQFIGKHFAGKWIRTIHVDYDEPVAEYDVMFTNGTKVEINANGNWEEVSNRTHAVPTTMLPATTQTYLKANYPSDKVLKIDKDRKGYDVKLASGLELEFDTQGSFIKIDR